jgi:hypothetical protein
MNLKAWKRLAEQEVYRYRDNAAYVRGVLDGGGTGGERMQRCARWVLAVDYTKAYLERSDPQKAQFFKQLFGLDAPRTRRREERTILSLSFELNVTTTTLYKWKAELLSLVLIAAAQTGALRPYSTE